MDWKALIDAAKAENVNGIEMRRGKKYTSVAVRVEIMRRYAGDLTVATEIVHWGAEKGAPIVVKATVTDDKGRTLATGHAEEIRGQGQVNTTSALENAETSAIGRALAALGLAGGEFASANELDAVERKKQPEPEPSLIPEPSPTPEPLSEDMATFNATIDATVFAMDRQPDLDSLAAFWKTLSKAVQLDARVAAAKDKRKGELQREAA